MIGLSLSGGGARGAYQAGVIKGLSEILPSSEKSPSPFSTFAGLSAGAINAVGCAAGAHRFTETSADLVKLWGSLETSDIYRSDPLSLGTIGLGWARNLMFGGTLKKVKKSRLLDVTPLQDLLTKIVAYDQIQKNIDSGVLQGLACTAFNYSLQKSMTFLQASKDINLWERPQRLSTPVQFLPKHLLASSAIPFLFPPVEIDGMYFGDGTLRNTAPLSPIIHMGCHAFFFVGVRHGVSEASQTQSFQTPSPGAVLGTILNGAFFDSLQIDFARVRQINRLVENGFSDPDTANARTIHSFTINPSINLGKIAEQSASTGLPPLVKYLIQGLGDKRESSELISYLLFDSVYTKQLIEIGYDDVYRQKDEALKFWHTHQ